MTEATAQLSRYRHAPRKVRLVADYVRGKEVTQALRDLDFIGKRSAKGVQKLIASAYANAKDKGHTSGSLYIDTVRVDEGPTLFRRRPRAMGRLNVIRKKTSHVFVALRSHEEQAQS